ncbi:MAG: cell division protein, partial [Gammaproteobacteria bacterium]|nr:cell division protein [Gammaproteobacteria bacterium]
AMMLSIGQLSKNPFGNLFSVIVIGITLALPTGLHLIVNNASQVLQNWEGNIQIAVYLNSEVSEERARQLSMELDNEGPIESITLITKEMALNEYKSLSGFAEALEALEENPLPNMLIIKPNLNTLSSEQGGALISRLGMLEEVETAQLDHQWVNRLLAILGIMKTGVIILVSLFSMAVLLIVGNTIRLSIINKRIEIEIDKLFGATNAFIRRPFLYSGFIYGASGGLVAWGLVLSLTLIMQDPVSQLAILYGSDFTLAGLRAKEVAILIATGGGLGLLGSWLAVGRHLRDTEPT